MAKTKKISSSAPAVGYGLFTMNSNDWDKSTWYFDGYLWETEDEAEYWKTLQSHCVPKEVRPIYADTFCPNRSYRNRPKYDWQAEPLAGVYGHDLKLHRPGAAAESGNGNL